MQRIQDGGVLQAGCRQQDADNRRTKIHRVSRLHKQTERIVISLVDNDEIEIDEFGKVWRVRVRKGIKSGGVGFYKIKKRRAEHPTPLGYLQVRAMIDGIRYHASAHRLVWHYFNGPIDFEMTINHKNGIKNDNRPENLEVVSLSDNIKHAHRNGLIDQYGQKNPQAKISDHDVARIRLAYSSGNFTQKDLAKTYGVTFQHISSIVRGDSRTKQGGKVDDYSHRRNTSGMRDIKTGRFVKKLGVKLSDQEVSK